MPGRLLTIGALAFVMSTASATTVLAQEHKVLGTVTTGAADHVMMTTTDGKTVTVKLTAVTKVTRGKEAVKIETVKAGTRIVVTTESDEDPYTAKLIEVGEAPKSPTKKK
jgi:DNA gyrase/topoisomerase IV subunit A